ncbi:MAG TPA: hypothetical protein VGJ01_13565 [Pseudolabrys sp.]|jgi:hypothetical protein
MQNTRSSLMAAVALLLAAGSAAALDQPKLRNNSLFDRQTPGIVPLGSTKPNPPLHDVVCKPVNYVEAMPNGSQRQGVAIRCD